MRGGAQSRPRHARPLNVVALTEPLISGDARPDVASPIVCFAFPVTGNDGFLGMRVCKRPIAREATIDVNRNLLHCFVLACNLSTLDTARIHVRDIFYGYYPPKDEDFKKLWQNGLIVLDTNVLLNLYRLPELARKDFLGILRKFSARIWVPHQVALEFQRRRLTVIASERKVTEEALKKASESIREIKDSVGRLQLDKRQVDIDVQATIKSLDDAKEKLVSAIKYAQEAQLDISATDSIRDELDEILRNRVGPGPADQTALDQIYAEGQARYQDKIPPGFSDIDKEKNPSEASFIHGHIKHQTKYGDFVLWKQTIDYVKDAAIENVIFVTADKKEDWWWKEHGKTLGPHPELIQEIRRQTSVKLFWLYSPDQFLEHASKFAAAPISKNSVQEIKNVSVFSDFFLRAPEFESKRARNLFHASGLDVFQSNAFVQDIAGVARWLTLNGYSDLESVGFPLLDIIARYNGERLGFCVRRVTATSIHYFSSIFKSLEKQIQNALSNCDIDSYGIFIILPTHESLDANYLSDVEEIVRQAPQLVMPGHAKIVVFGTVTDDVFRVLAEWNH